MASHLGVRFRTRQRNTVVYDVLREREGWSEVAEEDEDDPDSWAFFWADTSWCHEHLSRTKLAPHQRVNHFANHYELTRKDLLVKNLKRAKRALEREGQAEEASRYDFFPDTFALPADYHLFVEHFKSASRDAAADGAPAPLYIMKPVGKSQGKGIFLFNKLSQIADWRHRDAAEPYVCQRYVERPLLLAGKKFDLRVYVLVLSYSPLRVYLYRSGFARFAGARYSTSPRDIRNLEMHLTNVAVQRRSETFDARVGVKMDAKSLRLRLASRHGAEKIDRLFDDVQLLIVRSLLSVANVVVRDPHCFEIYGYDVIVDERLKPLLVEVNASPSLSADSRADYRLKRAMLHDALDAVDVEGLVSGERSGDEPPPLEVGGFDLVWDGGPVVDPDVGGARASCLGCHNESLESFRLEDEDDAENDAEEEDAYASEVESLEAYYEDEADADRFARKPR